MILGSIPSVSSIKASTAILFQIGVADTHNIKAIKSGVRILNREQKNEALYIRPHSPTVRACGFEPQYVSSILAGAANIKDKYSNSYLKEQVNKK